MPRYNSRYYSRSRWSGWSGFSLRLVGSLVVFAVAALSGAVIGGVGIYLINDAATPAPSAVANSNPMPAVTDSATTSTPAPQQAATATNGRSVRTVDPAFPPPSPVESRPAAPVATETATQSPAENPVSSAAIQPQPTAPQPTPQENLQPTAHDAVTHDAATQAAAPETSEHTGSPRKTSVMRKRVTITNARPSGLQATDQAQSITRRTFYDYYDRDNDQQRASVTDPDTAVRSRPDPRDPRAQRSLSQAQQRIIIRRQGDYYRDDRDADRRFRAPPQPARPLFGFFGGDR
jgi:hypothetical protein